MRRIFAQRFDHGVVIGNVDDLHFLDPEAHDLANGRKGERLEGAGDSHFAVADFGGQNLGGEFLFVEFLAELQVLDVVEKFDDFLVRAVAEGAEESCRQKFPAAFPAIQIDVEQIGGIELHFDPGTAIRNNPEAVKHLAVQMDASIRTRCQGNGAIGKQRRVRRR